MATSNKPSNKSSVKHSSHPTTDLDLSDLSTSQSFLVPHELFSGAIGFLSLLMEKRFFDLSFSQLYELSATIGWMKLFRQERQKLKPNENSVLKCCVLNRLLFECSKDLDDFVQRTEHLYNELQQRMRSEFPPSWTCQDLYEEIRHWQDMQCRRRLFYFSYQESHPQTSFLMLHRAASNWCHCLIQHCRKNRSAWRSEEHQRLVEHLQHSFMIVAQPTGSEGTAVTQYIKTNGEHSARLHCRLICLLDPVLLKDDIDLSDIEVTLFPLDHDSNDHRERQANLVWQKGTIRSAEGLLVSIWFAEMHVVQLEKFDPSCKRLLFNSTLCQLQFRLKIQITEPDFEGHVTLVSQPFGICSHGQYFPKYLAKIFLFELNQILKNTRRVLSPLLLTEFVRRYHIRMSGVAPHDHTNRYLRQLFEQSIHLLTDVKTTGTNNTVESLYEDILAKLIHQIDTFVLYPVLAMMYDDSLFLGICHSVEVEQMLAGTSEHPQLLLRLNSISSQACSMHNVVQLVVHDGHLKRASFDMKTFANEICRFICESTSEQIKQSSILSTIYPRFFTDFRWYFDEELYRLNKMAPPTGDVYDPVLPVLWMTLKHHPASPPMPASSPKRKKSRGHVSSSTSLDDLTEPLRVIERVDSHHKRQFLIEIPDDIDISADVLLRYLEEKFSPVLTGHKGDDHSSSYLLRPMPADDRMKFSPDLSSPICKIGSVWSSDAMPSSIEIKQEAQEYPQ